MSGALFFVIAHRQNSYLSADILAIADAGRNLKRRHKKRSYFLDPAGAFFVFQERALRLEAVDETVLAILSRCQAKIKRAAMLIIPAYHFPHEPLVPVPEGPEFSFPSQRFRVPGIAFFAVCQDGPDGV